MISHFSQTPTAEIAQCIARLKPSKTLLPEEINELGQKCLNLLSKLPFQGVLRELPALVTVLEQVAPTAEVTRNAQKILTEEFESLLKDYRELEGVERQVRGEKDYTPIDLSSLLAPGIKLNASKTALLVDHSSQKELTPTKKRDALRRISMNTVSLILPPKNPFSKQPKLPKDYLQCCPNLVALDAQNQGFQDKDIISIGELAAVHILNLKGNDIEEFVLQNPTFTYLTLANNPKLRPKSLLTSVKNMPNLQSLDVCNTPIASSEEWKNEFKALADARKTLVIKFADNDVYSPRLAKQEFLKS